MAAFESMDEGISLNKVETVESILYDNIFLGIYKIRLLTESNSLVEFLDELVELNQQLTLDIGDSGGNTEFGLTLEDDFVNIL